MLADHALEQPDAAGELFRHRLVAFFGHQFHPRPRESVGLHVPLEDPEAPLAEGHDLEHSELRHVPFADARQRADASGRSRCADLSAFGDEAHAEGRAVLEAGFRHLHVAHLEDAQRQPAARKKHGVQREKRQLVYAGFSVAFSRARPRCRTSTFQSAPKAAASFSAR